MFENFIKNKCIAKFNKKWQGKKVKLCSKIYSQALQTRYEEPFCSESPSCFNNYSAYEKIEPVFKFSSYIKNLETWIEQNIVGHGHCSMCQFSVESEPNLSENIIKKFIINNYTLCSMNCIYCKIRERSFQVDTKMKRYIQGLEKSGLLDKNCVFEWNGGEPSLYEEFQSLYSYLHSKGYHQVVYTSGVRYNSIYSDYDYISLFEDVLKNGDTVIISPDAGTERCFEGIKRSFCFEHVWKNIGYFASLKKDFIVKYTLFSLNSQKAEIEAFVKKCLENDVKKVIVDCEMCSISGQHPHPIVITEKEVTAAKLLKKFCEENNIACEVGPNWTVEYAKQISE